jgi:hypothetical protein
MKKSRVTEEQVVFVLRPRVRQISAEFARFRSRMSLQINELTLSVRKSL